MNIFQNIKDTLEKLGFGVCSYIGQKMGLRASRVRLYFIYASCMTLGSPLIFYLFFAFWLNIKKYLRRGKNLLVE